MQFNEYNLDDRILRGLSDLSIHECTPVQEKALQYTLKGQDIAAQSQTGTGKTAAFLITIFKRMLETDQKVKSLIIAPTRELVVQIRKDALDIGKYLDFRITSIIGGLGYKKQEAEIAKNPDIIVGTPGRLIDFIKQKKLSFEDIDITIIDEADRMFDMGFYPDIKWMMRHMPDKDKRQTMLFSATLSTQVRNLAWQFMNSPKEIEIEPENKTVNTVSQTVYHVANEEKFPLLLGLLKRENPESALIFTNTKHKAVEVAKRLSHNGYSCEFIIGDLHQKKRLRIIDGIKKGDLRFLVATDVAARGLHIEDLDIVVNYDIPEDPENYIHRIGRTARAGKHGKAISLACERFVYGLEPIQELIGMKIEPAYVEDELLSSDKSKDLKFHRGSEVHGDSPKSRRKGERNRSCADSGSWSKKADSRGRNNFTKSKALSESGTEAFASSRGKGERTPASTPRSSTAVADGPASVPGNREKPASRSQKDFQSSYSEKSKERTEGRGRKGRGQAQGRNKGNGTTKERNRNNSSGNLSSKKPTNSRNASLKDRLSYYKEKYGEDFSLTEKAHSGSGSGKNDKEKKKSGKPASFLGKIRWIFSGNR